MNYPINVSIKIKNYKCFGKEEPQGYDTIYPINIIIGRNNSGKSALIDLIKFTITPYDINTAGYKQKKPEVFLTKGLEKDEISSIFPENHSGGGIPGPSHYQYGIKWLNKPITIKLSYTNQELKREFISLKPSLDAANAHDLNARLTKRLVIPFQNKVFKMLSAERDIVSEGDSNELNPSILKSTGAGATNYIQRFLNKAWLDSSLVEKTLLQALNDIFNPDSFFERVVVQQHTAGLWEIFLEEKNKGRISLSNSGSGLKTIILVLINTILLPTIEKRELKDFVFAFEELENNLHPALQRKLLLYIKKIAKDNGCCFFLTTHSNVIIDLFSKDKEAQIIHITHDGDSAYCKPAKTYIDNKGILDDLDIRASDLLQANCIVWVEGPSDRLYFNKWVSIFSKGELQEGTHYQCVFYGGRLLSHLSASIEDSDADKIEILYVNRNSILLMDSDKRTAAQSLTTTKKRMISEIESANGITWVTKGKEVENYIPVSAIEKYLGTNGLRSLGKYEDIAKLLNEAKTGEGDRYNKNKVLFAENICTHLTKEDLENTLDLKEKLPTICDKIRNWNKF